MREQKDEQVNFRDIFDRDGKKSFASLAKESRQLKIAHALSSTNIGSFLSVGNLLILSAFRLWSLWREKISPKKRNEKQRKNKTERERKRERESRKVMRQQPTHRESSPVFMPELSELAIMLSYDACRCCCRWYGLHRRAFLSLYLLLLFFFLFVYFSFSSVLFVAQFTIHSVPFLIIFNVINICVCVLMHTSAGVNNTLTLLSLSFSLFLCLSFGSSSLSFFSAMCVFVTRWAFTIVTLLLFWFR